MQNKNNESNALDADPINKITKALKALVKPESKTSLVKQALPDIERCKRDGISNKVIAETLSANGLEIDQKSLASLLSRIRRENDPQKVKSKAVEKA